jgi:hypothetical protein
MAVSAPKPMWHLPGLAQLAPQFKALAKSMYGHQLPWQVGKVLQASTA